MLKSNKINYLAFNFCFISLTLSVASDLIVKGLPIKLFYISSYISIIYAVFYFFKKREKVNFKNPAFYFIISILILGCSKAIWSIYFHTDVFHDIRENYYLGGKRFILSTFIAFYFYKNRLLLNNITLNVGLCIMIIGLLASLFIAYQEHSQTGLRILLTADSATTSAYLIVIISMVALVYIQHIVRETIWSLALFIVVFLITMGMVIMTETRAAILFTPLLYFLFFLLNFRHVNKKIMFALTLIIIVTAAGTLSVTWERIEQIKTDIIAYHTNNDTSIGARFSIWKSGLYHLDDNFLGQSVDQRYKNSEDYINKYEGHNPEALRNVQYHLHNELIETLSLQGIIGFISLLFFYISGIIFALCKSLTNSGNTLYVIIPVFVFGLTDVVLIQSNTSMIICSALALSLPISKKKQSY